MLIPHYSIVTVTDRVMSGIYCFTIFKKRYIVIIFKTGPILGLSSVIGCVCESVCLSVCPHLIPPLIIEEFEEKELSISQGREPNVRRARSLHRDQMTPLLQEYSTSVLYYTITIQKTYLTEMAVAPLFVNGFSILKLHMKAEIQG